MDEVDLGTTKCNRNATSDWDAWWLPKSWDDAQNCVHGCISRMNEKSWDNACCGFQQQRTGATSFKATIQVGCIKQGNLWRGQFLSWCRTTINAG